MQIIGIDIGTTSISGVAIDAESGELLRSVTVNSEADLVGCAPFEKIQSPEKIIRTAKELLDALLCEEAVTIGVTGQMHGIVYLDRNGKAVSPLYTWQDGRGELPYRDTTYASYLGAHTGYGNVTDFYNRENGVRPKDAVTYSTIHDYFVMELTGRKKPLIHASDAASFGLYDMERGAWDWDLDAEVTKEYNVVGKYRGIPVAVAIGDNQASVFSTLTGEGGLLLNVGTGSQISVITPRILTGEHIETRPYFEGNYLTVGAALCGGRAYSLLKSFYGELLSYRAPASADEVYAIMDKMLEKSNTGTMVADTRFAGVRGDASITGSITGITTENFHPEQLTRAILCGMIGELHGMYLEMNVKTTYAVASGNGIRKNRHLARLAEEVFGCKLKMPVHLEEAAYGAALFGAISGGVFKNADAAQALIRYDFS